MMGKDSNKNSSDDLPVEPHTNGNLGTITYGSWEEYPWKNELVEQAKRISIHVNEIIQDKETDHNPIEMLQRALPLAAFCMRRMIECKLITSELKGSNSHVTIVKKVEGQITFDPLYIQPASRVFEDFDMQHPKKQSLSTTKIVDYMLHARILAVISGSSILPDGIIISSDKQMRHCLMHFTTNEFEEFCCKFRNDVIRVYVDELNPNTREVTSIRAGKGV